jgi:hypothetical protein
MPATRPTPEAAATGLPTGRAYGDDGSSGRRTVALIAAVAFAFAAVWAYIFFSQKPPVAEGSINGLVEVPIHTEIRQGGTAEEGHGGGVEAEDQIFVLVNATVKDTAKIPLFPFEQTGTLTLPTGEQKRIPALSTTDMMRAFRAYPALAKAHTSMIGGAPTPSLLRETTLKPGEAETGLVLFAFPVNQQDWDARRSFDMEISFRWQRDLALAEPAPKLQQ